VLIGQAPSPNPCAGANVAAAPLPSPLKTSAPSRSKVDLSRDVLSKIKAKLYANLRDRSGNALLSYGIIEGMAMGGEVVKRQLNRLMQMYGFRAVGVTFLYDGVDDANGTVYVIPDRIQERLFVLQRQQVRDQLFSQ
jgi:hypothetical protein